VSTEQPEPTVRVVCGIELALVAAEDGGRQTALLGGAGPEFGHPEYEAHPALPQG
jgi:hypothetical protein